MKPGGDNQEMAMVAFYKFSITTLLSVCAICVTDAKAEIRVAGSDTLENFFSTAITQYQRTNKVDFKVSFKGTGAGLKDLCEGQADIVPASSKIQPEQAKHCGEKKISFVEIPIAYDAIAVIINKANTSTTDLTMAELKSIFHPEYFGKVLRWNQVRSDFGDAPLKIMSLDAKSATNAMFTERVNQMRGYIRGDATVFHDHSKVIDAVSADANAIGFVSLGALSEHKGSVRAVPINFGKGAVLPDRTSILADSYAPLTRLLYLYIPVPALAKSEVKSFAINVVENGERFARFAGFVPLVQSNYMDGIQKIKTAR